MILLTDPLWTSMLLLSSARAKSLDIVPLLLPADKPVWIYFFGRFSGMKKAALEKFVPKCDIFFFFSKDHQVGGTMGRRYENIKETIHYEKISYTATQKYKKYQRLFCMDRPSSNAKRLSQSNDTRRYGFVLVFNTGC
jgi:hypothetical protein